MVAECQHICLGIGSLVHAIIDEVCQILRVVHLEVAASKLFEASTTENFNPVDIAFEIGIERVLVQLKAIYAAIVAAGFITLIPFVILFAECYFFAFPSARKFSVAKNV